MTDLPVAKSWTFGCRECSWEHTTTSKDDGAFRYIKHYAEVHRPVPVITPNLTYARAGRASNRKCEIHEEQP